LLIGLVVLSAVIQNWLRGVHSELVKEVDA